MKDTTKYIVLKIDLDVRPLYTNKWSLIIRKNVYPIYIYACIRLITNDYPEDRGFELKESPVHSQDLNPIVDL